MAYVPYAVTFGDRYEIVGAEGARAVFNDPTDPNYVGMLSEITGLDSPEVRESAEDLVEGDGGVHGSFYFGRRPITMTCRVFGHATLAERALRIDRARRATLAMRADSVLAWKPTTRRENFLINPEFNGGSTIGITPWAASGSSAGFAAGPTLSYSATGGSGNSAALRLQATQPADTTSRTASAGHGVLPVANLIPIVAGRSYHGQAFVNHVDAPATGSRVQIAWYKADGTLSATPSNSGPYVLAGAVGTATASLTATAPADAAYAQMRVQSTTNASGDVIDVYFDGMMFTETAMGTTYFSGSTAGFFWQGTPGASASGDFVEMYVPVRRQQPFRETGPWVKELQIALVSESAVIRSTGVVATPSTASGSGVAVENRGSYVTYPVIEITGVSANPVVTQTGGGVFRTGPSGFALNLAAGEKVEFDFLTHTGVFTAGARVGQSANRYIDFGLTTVWPAVRGATTETYTLTGGGTMIVKWRDAWV